MKKIRNGILLLVAIFGLAVAPVATSYAAKIDIEDANTENCTNSGGTQVKDKDGKVSCQSDNSLTDVFQTIANIMLFLVGAVAVIMLIIGGFRYVTSNGEAAAIKGAKDTILYAIIGIVVAFLAYAGVNFVTDSLTKGADTANSSPIHKTPVV